MGDAPQSVAVLRTHEEAASGCVGFKWIALNAEKLRIEAEPDESSVRGRFGVGRRRKAGHSGVCRLNRRMLGCQNSSSQSTDCVHHTTGERRFRGKSGRITAKEGEGDSDEIKLRDGRPRRSDGHRLGARPGRPRRSRGGRGPARPCGAIDPVESTVHTGVLRGARTAGG